MADHLQAFLDETSATDSFHSGFRPGFVIETALLAFVDTFGYNWIRAIALILLDLSAAFDMVNHDVLVDKLQSMFLVKGTALYWLYSFLVGRKKSFYRRGKVEG